MKDGTVYLSIGRKPASPTQETNRSWCHPSFCNDPVVNAGKTYYSRPLNDEVVHFSGFMLERARKWWIYPRCTSCSVTGGIPDEGWWASHREVTRFAHLLHGQHTVNTVCRSSTRRRCSPTTCFFSPLWRVRAQIGENSPSTKVGTHDILEARFRQRYKEVDDSRKMQG